jgi:hypothetical protein
MFYIARIVAIWKARIILMYVTLAVKVNFPFFIQTEIELRGGIHFVITQSI